MLTFWWSGAVCSIKGKQQFYNRGHSHEMWLKGPSNWSVSHCDPGAWNWSVSLWPRSLKLIRLAPWPESLKLMSHTVTWSVVAAVSVKLCKPLRQSISSCDLVCDNYNIWHHIIMEPFHRSVLRRHDPTCCNCYHAELSFRDRVSPWGGAERSGVKGLCTQKDEDIVKVSKQGWSETGFPSEFSL